MRFFECRQPRIRPQRLTHFLSLLLQGSIPAILSMCKNATGMFLHKPSPEYYPNLSSAAVKGAGLPGCETRNLSEFGY